MNIIKAVFGELAKAISFPVARTWFYRPYLPGERDYRMDVGDGSTSSIVLAIIFWLCRTFPEATPVVKRREDDGYEPVHDHPMTDLLANPNPHYSGVLLWMATIVSWIVDGNVYWLKSRSAAGRVVELWYVPHWMMEPKWPDDGSEYISHYEYRPGGTSDTIRLDPKDVVHLRFGLDPENTRKGMSQIAAGLREVYTDNEASRFTAALLRNLGVPGLIMTPEGDAVFSQNEALSMKALIKSSTSGENRGDPLVTTGPAKIQQFGFSPTEMDLSLIRGIPEERLTALIGIPAVVVGFGAGLRRSTFENFSEAREAAYESNIIPTYRIFGAELVTQLLTDFVDGPQGWLVEWDTSKVRVLQEDQNALATRIVALAGGPVITRAEGRQALGFPTTPADEIFQRPLSLVDVPANGMLMPQERTVAALPPGTDQNPMDEGEEEGDNEPKMRPF